MARKKIPSPETGDPFEPLVLDKTVTAIPLLEKIRKENKSKAKRVIYSVIIDLNLEYPSGRDGARGWVIANVKNAKQAVGKKSGPALEAQDVDQAKSKQTHQYLFAALEDRVIQELVRLDEQAASLARETADTELQQRGPHGPVRLTARFTESGPTSKSQPSSINPSPR
jgi:hypothetical protein